MGAAERWASTGKIKWEERTNREEKHSTIFCIVEVILEGLQVNLSETCIPIMSYKQQKHYFFICPSLRHMPLLHALDSFK